MNMAQREARLRVPGDFGLALQQARMSRGLSQAELARQIGVSQSAVSEMENGSGTIYLRRLLELARLSGLEFHATWSDDAPSR